LLVKENETVPSEQITKEAKEAEPDAEEAIKEVSGNR
jgi:hypothetical protein